MLLLCVFYRHDNFVIVSHLVNHNSLRDVSLLANVSATNAGNLSFILGLTADMLYSMHTPDDARYYKYHNKLLLLICSIACLPRMTPGSINISIVYPG